MKRGGFIQRKTPLRATRRRKPARAPKTAGLAFPRPEAPKGTAYSRRPRETGRMLFYKSLPCDVPSAFFLLFGTSLPGPGPHEGETQAMHLGEHGLSNKCDDDETAPGCRGCHDDIDGRSGRRKRAWWSALSYEQQAELRGLLIARADGRWRALSDDDRAAWDARAATRGRRAA